MRWDYRVYGLNELNLQQIFNCWRFSNTTISKIDTYIKKFNFLMSIEESNSVSYSTYGKRNAMMSIRDGNIACVIVDGYEPNTRTSRSLNDNEMFDYIEDLIY